MQIGRIAPHHEVAAHRDTRSHGEHITDPVRESPVAQVHCRRSLVIKLNVLVIVIARDRMIHQLVDHHVLNQHGRVRVERTRRRRRERMKLPSPIRKTPHAHTVGLRLEAHGIEHTLAIGADQVDVSPGHAQGKAELGLVKRQKVICGEDNIRKEVLVGCRTVSQEAAVHVHGTRAVVVNLNEIILRICVRQELIDLKLLQCPGRIGRFIARRSTDKLTLRPSPHIVFAKVRLGQHQAVPGPVGSNRPGHRIIILYFQQDRIQMVSNTDSTATV